LTRRFSLTTDRRRNIQGSLCSNWLGQQAFQIIGVFLQAHFQKPSVIRRNSLAKSLYYRSDAIAWYSLRLLDALLYQGEEFLSNWKPNLIKSVYNLVIMRTKRLLKEIRI